MSAKRTSDTPAVDPSEGRLERWSRLKRTHAEDARKGPPAVPPEEGDPPSASPPPQLPDVDSLDKDSDFSAFLAEAVPEEIRRRALRLLWRSDPVLANLDGLNDYDEDFRLADGVAEALRTAYEVGKPSLTDRKPAKAPPATQQPKRDVRGSDTEPQRSAIDTDETNQDDEQQEAERSVTEVPSKLNTPTRIA